jgi:hypothetical protein
MLVAQVPGRGGAKDTMKHREGKGQKWPPSTFCGFNFSSLATGAEAIGPGLEPGDTFFISFFDSKSYQICLRGETREWDSRGGGG